MSRVLWLPAAAVLLLAPMATVSAQPLETFDVSLEVVKTAQRRSVTYQVTIVAPTDGDAYFKVLPTTGNPVFLNGTPRRDGWWAEARLQQGRNDPPSVATNGSAPVSLGPVAKGQAYALVIQVSAPKGSLAQPQTYRINFALAVRQSSASGGSGGTLDPSWTLRGVLQVLDEPARKADHAGARRASSLDLAGLGFALSAAALLVARRGANPEGRAPAEPGPPGSTQPIPMRRRTRWPRGPRPPRAPR